MFAGRLAVAFSSLALVLALALAWPPVSSGVTLPRVTVIGDSAATGIRLYEPARTRLARGVSLRLELAVCRSLARRSCPYKGARPANLLDVVTSAGTELGETVIVAVGYNDLEEQYADDIGVALAALRGAGVKRILWATLRGERTSYLTMNNAIRDAVEQNPDVSLVDWNLYSRSHPDWFQPDGIHLTDRGAEAMAELLHDALVKLDVAVTRTRPAVVAVTPKTLPTARVGTRFSATLRARGGKPPYRWALDGKRPAGLVLTPAGRITWLPRAAGRFRIAVRIVDADGTASKRVLALSSR